VRETARARFRRALLPLLLPSCLLVTLAPHAPAQRARAKPSPEPRQEEEVESVSTTLVAVPVRVSDRAGRFITDLRREQFRVFEDGVEQEISFFEPADHPFTVALMLDVSDSASLQRGAIQAAARAFVGQLRAGDRVMIATFDHDIAVLTDPTDDRQVLFEAINRVRTGGGTSFYDAVEELVGKRLSRVPGRKAVVILTDGIDTTSRATQSAAERAADESNALVYAVQYDTVGAATPSQGGQPVSQVIASTGEPVSAAYKRATLFLRMLADRTGGRFYQAASVKRLSESFARIAEELRQQYSLGYYPKNREGEGKRRKLKVTVDAPEARVRARGAYVYKPRRVSRRGDRRDAVATLDD
jgi:Ca-activated chloride channel family protein